MAHTLRFVDELLRNENWKCRHAAIMSLSTIGEGCKRQMEPIIHEIVTNMVLQSVTDPVGFSFAVNYGLYLDTKSLRKGFFVVKIDVLKWNLLLYFLTSYSCCVYEGFSFV